MILLIDNYDSFSYNLYQLIGAVEPDIKVVRNDECTLEEIAEMKPEAIIYLLVRDVRRMQVSVSRLLKNLQEKSPFWVCAWDISPSAKPLEEQFLCKGTDAWKEKADV